MQVLLQLGISLLLFILCALVHGTGLVFMSKLFSVEEREVRRQRLVAREFQLMLPMALCLFLIHAAEIFVFALFYVLVGATPGLEEGLFVSASAYTTLGHQEPAYQTWRLVGAFEGLSGFLLIGWSAAMFVTDMEQVLRKRFD